MTNTGDTAWNFSGALHSYLNIGDIEQLSTTGMGPEYIDKLQDSKLCQGENTLILTDTIDRVYTQPSDKIVVTDPVLKRQLTIQNAGHNSAVLWNPWQKGAASIGDMNEDSYKTMFCVESTLFAPHLAAGKALQPNESHTLSTVIAKQ
jgi:glucose-6-phosphate 1-epimerase